MDQSAAIHIAHWSGRAKRYVHGLGFEPRQAKAYQNLNLTP